MTPEVEAIAATWGAGAVFWTAAILATKIQDVDPPGWLFVVFAAMSWALCWRVGDHIYKERMAEEV